MIRLEFQPLSKIRNRKIWSRPIKQRNVLLRVQRQLALTVLLLASCDVTSPVQPSLEPQVNPWQPVGGVVAQGATPSLASKNGKNTLAFYANDGTSNNVYVKRWNGVNWVQLGGALDVGLSNGVNQPSLALNSLGEPMVSWHECEQDAFGICHAFNIHVKRWDGLAWSLIGKKLNISSPSFARSPSLALNNAGSPTVSWDECLNLDANAINCVSSTNIYVKRWNGTTWVMVGAAPLDTTLASESYSPSLSLADGSLSVAWREGPGSDRLYVKQHISNSW